MKDDKYIKTIKAYSKLGKGYIEAVKDFVPLKFDDILKLLPQKGLALDVGCAGGKNSKHLTERGFEVIGIDLVDVFLEHARKNIPEVKFLKMDVLKLDFPDNNFDFILANAILLHIKKEDMLAALRDLYRILKSGGKIYIGVKKGKGSSYVTDKLSSVKRMFVYYEKDEIEKLLQEVGFKIIFSEICKDVANRKDVKWIALAAEK